MKIDYSSEGLRKKCEQGRILNTTELNLKVVQRLRELEAAPNLLTIKKLKYLRLHPLNGKNRYELAIDVNKKVDPNRIVFECLDWENVCDDFYNELKFVTVTWVNVLSVGDYH